MGNLQHQAALPEKRLSAAFTIGYDRSFSKGQLFFASPTASKLAAKLKAILNPIRVHLRSSAVSTHSPTGKVGIATVARWRATLSEIEIDKSSDGQQL